jgi:hypothetical protein
MGRGTVSALSGMYDDGGRELTKPPLLEGGAIGSAGIADRSSSRHFIHAKHGTSVRSRGHPSLARS